MKNFGLKLKANPKPSNLFRMVLTISIIATGLQARDYQNYMRANRDKDNCEILSNSKKCKKCSEEYYLTSAGKCLRCPQSNCLSCKAQRCLQCAQGFHLKGKNCKKCPKRCALCSSNKKCDHCAKGYSLIKGECVQVFGEAEPEKVTFWMISVLMTSFVCLGLRSRLASRIEKMEESEFCEDNWKRNEYEDVSVGDEVELGVTRKRKVVTRFDENGILEGKG